MIERLWSLLQELGGYVGANFDPVRDLIDVLVVTAGIYWLLLLIRGTRAVQILVGLIVLIAASAASNVFQLVTLRLILENFASSSSSSSSRTTSAARSRAWAAVSSRQSRRSRSRRCWRRSCARCRSSLSGASAR